MAAHELNSTDSVPQPRRTAPLAPPSLTSTPDAMSLLKALRRRWFLAGSLGLLAAVIVGATAWILLPARYTAFALLQVSSKPNPLTEKHNSRDEFAIAMKTTAARLKSRDVLMRSLSQDPVRNLTLIKRHPDTLSTLTWMEEVLKIDIQENSELLTVSLTGDEPGDLQVIVNNMVKSFMTIVGAEEKARRKDRLDKAKFLYEAGKEKLAEKVNAKDNLLKSQNVKDPWAMMNLLQNTQTELRQAQGDGARYRFDLERKRAQLANYQNAKKNLDKLTIEEVPQKEVLDFDPNLRKEMEQVERLQKHVERLLKEGHPPDDSIVRQAKLERENVRKRLDERMLQVKTELVQKVKAKHADAYETAMANLQSEIVPLEKFVAETRERTDILLKDLERVNISTRKYDLLDAEIHQEQKNTDRLFDVFKQAQMEEESEPRITPIGEAELQNRDAKKRGLMLIAAPITAFLMMLVLVAWWEFAARRIQEPDEVVAGLAIRVVGAVPEVQKLAADPKSDAALRHNLIESIDAIRTMLLRNADAENLRVVMVTSAETTEGKTALASNLAMSLARAGRKTLLIDCDLRRPAVHTLFDQPLQPGFSEVMLHEVDLPDALRVTAADPNLSLLTAGMWDRSVVQELAKSGITSIFEKLRDEFDFIIVEAHPVLAATDSLVIGQYVDTVLVSLMRDVSQMHNVQAACQQLTALGIRVFGAVVSGMPVKTFGKPTAPAKVEAQPVSS